MEILSWNVNGIRAAEKKGAIDFLINHSPDILCLQETKAAKEQLDDSIVSPPGYHSWFSSAEKKGYSGVAIYSKVEPISVESVFEDDRFNHEGRILIADYKDFVLFNLYFPNGQKDDERLQFKMDFNEQLLKEVEKYKDRKILVCGDYNTAHQEMDLKNPKANEKYSGFLPIERDWIDRFIKAGFTDTYRYFHPEQVEYSWWSYRFQCRKKNVGWRIDYHFVNEALLPHVKDASIMTDIMGSDHCPVKVQLEF